MNMNKILKNISYLIIIFIITLTLSYFLTKYYSKKITKPIYSYAESEAKRLTTTIINDAISKQNLQYNEDKLYTIEKNNKGEIQLINFNTKEVTILLSNITKSIEDNIENINNKDYKIDSRNIIKAKDGLIYELPIGAVTGNIFLNSLGTKIPLKLQIIGDVISEVDSNVSEYGLNNALLKIDIKTTINTRIIAPFTSKEMTFTNRIPLSIKVIQGTVPNYYLPNQTN